MAKRTKNFIAGIAAVISASSLIVQTAEILDRRVVIIVPAVTDDRLSPTREALTFWNQTLQELRLKTKLVERALIVASGDIRAYENYAQQLWRQAGRLSSEQPGPKAPRELLDIDGEIVVFLSKQRLMSFAWPVWKTQKYFVAIGTRPSEPEENPANIHNVIAHELGHALGLTHSRNPMALMCSPCRSFVIGSYEKRFLPLTAEDRSRLSELYR